MTTNYGTYLGPNEQKIRPNLWRTPWQPGRWLWQRWPQRVYQVKGREVPILLVYLFPVPHISIFMILSRISMNNMKELKDNPGTILRHILNFIFTFICETEYNFWIWKLNIGQIIQVCFCLWSFISLKICFMKKFLQVNFWRNCKKTWISLIITKPFYWRKKHISHFWILQKPSFYCSSAEDTAKSHSMLLR